MTFAEILTELGVPYATAGNHCRPGWVNFDCPWCGRDSGKNHCGYNIAFRYVNCWRCGAHNLGQTVAELANIPVRRARELLRDLEGGEPVERIKKRGRLKLPDGICDLLPAHRKYLRDRGFDPDELAKIWGLRAIGIGGRLAWRVFIPISFRGETVSWTTRAIADFGPRYISAPADAEAIPAKSVLYGIDYARGAIAIVEGPADAWAIGPGAVATLGTGFSTAQVALMAAFPVRVVCFDAENAAQRRANQLCDMLAGLPGRTSNAVLDAPDRGSASNRELRQIRKLLR